MKKILTVILTVLISFTTLSINVVAEEPQVDSLNEIKEELPEEEVDVLEDNATEVDTAELPKENAVEDSLEEEEMKVVNEVLNENSDEKPIEENANAVSTIAYFVLTNKIEVDGKKQYIIVNGKNATPVGGHNYAVTFNGKDENATATPVDIYSFDDVSIVEFKGSPNDLNKIVLDGSRTGSGPYYYYLSNNNNYLYMTSKISKTRYVRFGNDGGAIGFDYNGHVTINAGGSKGFGYSDGVWADGSNGSYLYERVDDSKISEATFFVGDVEYDNLVQMVGYGFNLPKNNPTKEGGYDFVGWFDSKEGGNQINSNTKFDGTVKNVYARFEKLKKYTLVDSDLSNYSELVIVDEYDHNYYALTKGVGAEKVKIDNKDLYLASTSNAVKFTYKDNYLLDADGNKLGWYDNSPLPFIYNDYRISINKNIDHVKKVKVDNIGRIILDNLGVGYSGSSWKSYDSLYAKLYGIKEEKITWTFEADGDTITAICSKASVEPVKVKIVANGEFVYSGNVPEGGYVTLQGKTEFEEATGKTLEVKFNTEDGTAPINAGTYKATVTVENATAELEFVISPLGVDEPTLNEEVVLTYNGQPQSPTLIGFVSDYMEYVNDASLGLSNSETDAGNYICGVKLKDNNHTWISEEETKLTADGKGIAIINWTIKPMEIKAITADAQYTGKPVYVDITFNNPIDDLVLEDDYTVSYKDSHTRVGKHTATIKLLNPNYTFGNSMTLDVNFNITARVYDYENDILPLVDSLTYNGDYQRPIKKLPAGMVFAPLDVAIGYTDVAKDAGEYKAIIRLNDDNFTWSEDTIKNHSFTIWYPVVGNVRYVVVPWKIDKKEIQVNAESYTKVYGDADPIFKLDPECRKLFATNKDYYNAISNIELIRLPGESVKRRIDGMLGNYMIYATINGDAIKNYIVNVVPGSLTITPAPLSLSLSDYRKVYDGYKFTPDLIIDGLKFEDELVSGVDYYEARFDDGAFSNDGPSYVDATTPKAGEKHVRVQLTNSNLAKNYYLDDAKYYAYVDIQFDILKADLTINVNDAKMYRNKALPEFTYELEGLAETDELTCELVTDADTSKRGTYKITVDEDSIKIINIDYAELEELTEEFDVTESYNITVNPGVLTVKKHHKVDDDVKVVATGIE